MNITKLFQLWLIITTISLGIIIVPCVFAAAPSVSNITVTDVTPTAFSVVWGSNQPGSTCTLNVFTDEAGTTPAGATVTSEIVTRPEAGNRGIMKVRVTGVQPTTTYYYQTSTTSGVDTTLYPAAAPFPSVRTETETQFVSNDTLVVKVFEADDSTPVLANGAILIATVTGASYPVSGWAGDGVPAGYAGVDLNNLYSSASRKSLELAGGENIEFLAFGGANGSNGCATVVPAETGGMQLVNCDIALPVELSIFSAVVEDSHIILKWRTESEINNLGFDVYRSENPDGKFVKVNPAYIKGAGTDSTPHDYQFVDESAAVGKTYYYYLETISFSGERERSHIIKVIVDISGKVKVTGLMQPTTFALLQNFPNPFNPETWIPFRLANDADVTIRIFDIRGQEIRAIYLGQKPAGDYDTKGKAVLWDGRDSYGQEVSSGIYFYNLTAGNFSATKKLTIIK